MHVNYPSVMYWVYVHPKIQSILIQSSSRHPHQVHAKQISLYNILSPSFYITYILFTLHTSAAPLSFSSTSIVSHNQEPTFSFLDPSPHIYNIYVHHHLHHTSIPYSSPSTHLHTTISSTKINNLLVPNYGLSSACTNGSKAENAQRFSCRQFTFGKGFIFRR